MLIIYVHAFCDSMFEGGHPYVKQHGRQLRYEALAIVQ